MKRARVVAIQRDVSLNELMPELSLLLGTYISALRGESEVFEAIGDQFGGIKPGYSFGLEFEMPWRNRAAHSRLAQRKLQFAKISAEIDEVIQNVIAESQVSLRQITSAKQTLDAALQAIDAQAELDLKSAEIDLQRTMGTLLIQQQVSYHRGNENGRAQVIIDKHESTPTRQPVPFQQANPDQSPAPSVQGFFYKNLKD
jgi:outer membrane protein TolC